MDNLAGGGFAASTSAQPQTATTTTASDNEAATPTRQQSPIAATTTNEGSRVDIVLLLSNGNRHLYPIDARYLGTRNVNVADGDPFNLTVYEVKELILRDWRDDWEAKPSSPSYIRLIFMGSMLSDNEHLRETRLSKTAQNIIHMTIKPAETVEEDGDNPKTGKVPSRRDTQSANSRCCIVM
ncbi:hypothetical protein EJ08DRAFT_582832 [Tothia fuscella]|uniref:Ubiquitin-like domain-containing protein n=1 Tax=Tothia fuscella TaxID=1048955 RepID=A0A9P4U0R9_9PEZI|nr:hypothetical protein EJ08DRAFT_582832 [Tothia fuscella]